MSISPIVLRLALLTAIAQTGCYSASNFEALDLVQTQAKPSLTAVELLDPVRPRTWRLDESGLFVIDSPPPSSTRHDTASLAGTRKIWEAALTHRNSIDAAARQCDNDLALDLIGNVVVAEKNSSSLLRVSAHDLAVTVHVPRPAGSAFEMTGFAGITYAPAWRSYFALDRTGRALWIIDEQLTQARPMMLTQPITNPCRLSLPIRVRPGIDEWTRYRRFCVLTRERSISIAVNPQLRRAESSDRACESGPALH